MSLLGVYIRRPLLLVLVIVAFVLVIIYLLVPSSSPLRIGTFNIETYPQTPGQSAGAVQLLGTLEVDVVGVQEITRRDVFRQNVELYLGSEWDSVFPDQVIYHSVGLVYNREVLRVLEVDTHHETVIHRGARATLEVRLETKGGGRKVRVFVVHLKARSEGFEIRRRQLAALLPIVERAMATGDEVVVLGDFNSTGPADHVLIAEFAGQLGLDWTSREIECTSYWDRGEECVGTALDQILGSRRAKSVEVRGACETVGCETRDSCPIYVRLVSDHCPVTVVY